MAICIQEMFTSPNDRAVSLKKAGRACLTKGSGRLPQMIMARFCRKMDMPMAVIRAASLGAFRRGR